MRSRKIFEGFKQVYPKSPNLSFACDVSKSCVSFLDPKIKVVGDKIKNLFVYETY